MTLNLYRLRHLSKTKKSAKVAQNLLRRPDRLLGIILMGNNFVNILASALATILASHYDLDVLAASFVLTVVILVFAEISPKTLAALYPERLAFLFAYPLQFLLWVLYPVVWLLNGMSNSMLRLFGISSLKKQAHHLNPEELRTIVHETSGHVPIHHREMMLGILDLEHVSVEEIMVPRSEIVAIDLDMTDGDLIKYLASTQHTFVPVYRGDLDNTLGILHTRQALNLMADNNLSKNTLEHVLAAPYFVPEGTPLTQQLLEFKQNQRRLGLVVNEYGDILGLIALEDILEEVVGEFTTDVSTISKDIHPQEDGTFLVDGSVTIRELNRAMGWTLPTTGPKTLSGLIIDYLEMIPELGTCCLIDHVPIEVVQVSENRIKTARLSKPLKPHVKDEEHAST